MAEETEITYTAEEQAAIGIAIRHSAKDVTAYNQTYVRKFRIAIGGSSSKIEPFIGFEYVSKKVIALADYIKDDGTIAVAMIDFSAIQDDYMTGLLKAFDTDIIPDETTGTNTLYSNTIVIYEEDVGAIGAMDHADVKAMILVKYPDVENPGAKARALLSKSKTTLDKAKQIIADLQMLQNLIDKKYNEHSVAAPGSEAYVTPPALVDGTAAASAALAASATADIERRKAEAAATAGELEGALTKTQILYKEQCFLMARIYELVDYKLKNSAGKAIPYKADTANPTGGNACIEAADNPFAFMNKMTQYPNACEFFDMKPENISTLVPMIRLFKVNSDEKGNESQVELKFNTNPTFKEIQSYVTDKNKRGFGAGVKDFTFTYDGSNPFSAKKSIRAKLTILANGFDELFKCRGAGGCDSDDKNVYENSYRYIDLALKTGKTSKKAEVKTDQERLNLAKLEFRLKAVVGWAMPRGFPDPTEDSKLLKAINNSFVTLNLTPTIHEFNLEEDGRVNFTINYLAYVEEFFDQPQFNIFSDVNVSQTMTLRKLIFDNIKNSKKCLSSEISELKKAEADGIALEKTKSLQFLTEKLLAKGYNDKSKMKYINLSRVELVKFQNSGVFYEPSPEGADISGIISDDVSDPVAVATALDEAVEAVSSPPKEEAKEEELSDEEKTKKFEELLMEPGSETIPFFFVSDLIDIILQGIEENLKDLPGKLTWPPPSDVLKSTAMAAGVVDTGELKKQMTKEKEILKQFAKQYKKFRVVLGPLEVRNPKGSYDKMDVSLGDLPVSYKYFLEWLTKKLLAKNQTVYNLAQFLNDFFNTLIKEFMNNDTCFKINTNQKTRLTQAAITSYKNKEGDADELTQKLSKKRRLEMNKFGFGDMPLLNLSGPTDLPIVEKIPSTETNYLMFFAGRTMPSEVLNGIRGDCDGKDDHSKGIFHYSMGRNRGLVKNISLSRTDAKFLKEVRFEQDGYDGLKQLREVYDIEISAYPVVNAYPGTYIYVDPLGWLPNAGLPGSDVPLDLTQYGIGGYCMIWKSDHSFAPGRAESKIYAKWVASIGAKGAAKGAAAPAEPATEDAAATDCGKAIKEATEAEGVVATSTGEAEVGEAPAEGP